MDTLTRWHSEAWDYLLKTFDEIYILNLHDSSRKKKTDDGSIGKNVFCIQTGVTIAIFTKYKMD